ncbi:MAG: nuclear transport factor 2 family protein [Bacteroidetes bacterium]|nr:nuclear transport factor 2 family protein [Bacteroidota bacterium]
MISQYCSITGWILLVALFLSTHAGTLFAQSGEDSIRAVREASNAALKALDEEANFEFLTDDVLITTGNGTLLCGKDELKAFIESAADAEPMYWIRTPDEIIVNEYRGLAWETGIWHGYYANDPNEENPIFYGNYAAQWIRVSGEWKIQSQLFVMLN